MGSKAAAALTNTLFSLLVMFTVLGASGWLMIFFRLLYLVLRILPIFATFGVVVTEDIFILREII